MATADSNNRTRKIVNPITGEEEEIDSETGLPSGGFTFNSSPAAAPVGPVATPTSTSLAEKVGSAAPVPDLKQIAESVDDITETAVGSPPGPSLSEKVRAGTVGGVTEKPGQPSKEHINTLMEQLAGLKKAEVPGDTTDWDAKLSEAQNLKEEGASRSAWAGLAQKIGEGLIQIAAARDARRHGIAPVEIKAAPSAYEALMKNTENDYRDRVDAINKSHQYSQQQRNELIMHAERDYDDSRKAIEDQIGGEKFKYGEDVRQVERSQDRAERERMHGETLAATRANAEFRDTETERKTGLAQVNQSLRDLSARKKAAADLAAKLSTYDDLPSKEQKAFPGKNAALLGKAGVTEESLQTYLEPAGTGFFSRTFGEGKDPAVARKELIQKNILSPLQAEESDLLQQRESLSHPGARGGSNNSVSPPTSRGPTEGGTAPAPNERGAGSAPAGMVHMRDPRSGREVYVRKDQVAEAQRNGAVVVGD